MLIASWTVCSILEWRWTKTAVHGYMHEGVDFYLRAERFCL